MIFPQDPATYEAQGTLARYPVMPMRALYEELMRDPLRPDVAAAIAMDPLCGVDRRSTLAEGMFSKGHFNLNSSKGGVTPLMLASICGAVEVARRLLESGADPKAVEDEFGYNALHVAVGSEMVLLLAKWRCNVNARCTACGFTPSHLCASFGKLQELAELVRADADMTVSDYWGLIPLHLAILQNQLEIVAFLARLPGSNLNVSRGGSTALQQACSNERIMQVLIDNGADIDAIGEDGQTALNRVVSIRGPSRAFDLLLANGCSTVGGERPFMNDVAIDSFAVTAEKLLDAGWDIAARSSDSNGYSALHCAAMRGIGPIIKLFLDQGADPNLRDNYLNTPLHAAAKYGQVAAIQLLVNRGANVLSTNCVGQIPLHAAALSGRPSTIETIAVTMPTLARQHRDYSNKTPLDVFDDAIRQNLLRGVTVSQEAIESVRLLLYAEQQTVIDDNKELHKWPKLCAIS